MALAINKKESRKFLLDAAMRKWPDGKMRRVSEDALLKADAAHKTWMLNYVAQHPTLGHTIK